MTRRRNDDDDTILRDGESLRVPMMLRDADSLSPLQRAVAENSRPHWRDAADRYFDRRVNVRDAAGGTRGLNRPGFRIDRRVSTDARAEAYRLYDEEIGQAYRSAPPGAYPYSAAAEGTACTIDGAPGTLVREGNVLVCRPTQRQDGRQDHALTMDAAYQAYDKQISEAWRTR
jgi:hypothetical protein